MIIVTGGAGLIGSAVVWQLNRRGYDQILVVDNLASTDKWKNLSHLSYGDYWHKSELLRRLERGTLPEQVDAVVHLGACSSTTERDVDYLMQNNFECTRSLAQWCLARGVRFIYASSAATYGDGALGYSDDLALLSRLRPLNAYGYSKHRFDLWAQRSGALRQIVGLKFFNVFGPDEYHKAGMTSVVFKAYHQVVSTGRVELFRSYRPEYPDGGQMRDFIYVKDCAAVVEWLLENPVAGLFNLGTGQARSWNDLATAVFRALGRESRIEYIDMPQQLQNQYQYFTQADMQRFRATGCPVRMHTLEAAVHDYVTNYLHTSQPYLSAEPASPPPAVRKAA